MADDSMAREWRVLQDLSDFEISSFGDVRRRYDHPFYKNKCPSGQILPQWRTQPTKAMRDGRHKYIPRMMVDLRQNGVTKKYTVARLVCRAFHGEPPTPAHQAAHGNGNQVDDRSVNLRWATSKENHADKKHHGTLLYGEKSVLSILTEKSVLEILDRAKAGVCDIVIAKDFGINLRHVRDIRLCLTWQHIERSKIYVRKPRSFSVAT